MSRPPLSHALIALLPTLALLSAPAAAQDGEPASEPVRKLIVEPARLDLQVGEQAQLEVRVEEDGAAVEEDVMFYSRSRRSVTVTQEGQVEALAAGEHVLIVRTRRKRGERLMAQVPVTVRSLPLQKIELHAPDRLFAGTAVEIGHTAWDIRGEESPEAEVELTSDRPGVASFDDFGRLALHQPGVFKLVARGDGAATQKALEVLENPVV